MFPVTGGFQAAVLMALAAAFAAIAGCSENAAGSEDAAANSVVANLPVPPPPGPNYDEKEGDVYLYVAAVSEEDRQAGKSAGDVIRYRYLGQENGVYRLALLDDGTPLNTSECPRRCKVVKTTWKDGTVDRRGFAPESLIGSAFEDAFNGHLTASSPGSAGGAASSKNEAREGPVIPAAFVGEWNEDPSHCGTALNHTALKVEPGQLLFYESVAQVTGVTNHDSRSVTVHASFEGEGETWTNSVKMSLDEAGNKLTIDNSTRRRCPS